MLMHRAAFSAPVLTFVLLLASSGLAAGHGGVYRGPGSTIGPGGATAGGPSTGGAGLKDTDVAAWDQWWSFNRDRYLALKDAIFDGTDTTTGTEDFFLGKGSDRGHWGPGLKPTEKVLRGEVVPALRAALVKQMDVDIITGVLLALAKIGDPPAGPKQLSALFSGYLTHGNQEVHETAAIALGILGESDAAPLLQDLMLDTSAGRRAMGRGKVPVRTRAFAAYGLGLIGYRSDAQAVKRFVVHHLARAIALGEQPTRDLIVAAVISMGIVQLDSLPPHSATDQTDEPTLRVSSSREGQIEFLLGLWDDQR
ncbi:MAG: HEAT repeat domain-containing protein, partial [Planctomycetota bacterium]